MSVWCGHSFLCKLAISEVPQSFQRRVVSWDAAFNILKSHTPQPSLFVHGPKGQELFPCRPRPEKVKKREILTRIRGQASKWGLKWVKIGSYLLKLPNVHCPKKKRESCICLRISPLRFDITSSISSLKEGSSVCWSGLRCTNRGNIWSFTQWSSQHWAKVNGLMVKKQKQRQLRCCINFETY